MTEKEALKLAMAALVKTDAEPGSKAWEREAEAITAIKEALAQPEQEPVACVEYIPCCTDQTCPKCKAATPPQRKPLTNEEIQDLLMPVRISGDGYYLRIARAIEAAHGIQE